jgi:C1A family cysteine protease
VCAKVATATAAKKEVADRTFNCIRTVESPGDTLTGMHNMPAGTAPTNVDLREAWWKIGDQKDSGSCVGWAVGDGVLRHYLTKKGRLNEKDRLSVRYIWMAAKETDEFDDRPTTFLDDAGTSIGSAFRVVRRFGCVTEDMLPFGGLSFSGFSEEFFASAQNLKVEPFTKIQNDPDVWKRWLAEQGPMAGRLLIDRSFAMADTTAPLLDKYRSFAEPWQFPHAVCIVGYTTGNEFIIRNSWGATWGKDGFALATIEYMREAFTEFFGVYSSF